MAISHVKIVASQPTAKFMNMVFYFFEKTLYKKHKNYKNTRMLGNTRFMFNTRNKYGISAHPCMYYFLDIPNAYCLVISKEPLQKKKTKTVKGTKDPVWNESFVL